MLEMRPNCECCDADLPPEADAYICSFECTYCPACARAVLKGVCPNCGGALVARPKRNAALLKRFPPSDMRVLKEGGCAQKTMASD
ncbi:MAG: DUF1272 domain-containing protein [Parvularculaceae bacterium]